MRAIYLLALLALWACDNANPSNDNAVVEETEEIGINSLLGLELERLQMPDGFNIEVYGRVKNARSMVMGENGTLFIGNRAGGSVYAVRDTDGDFKIDERYELISGLNMPNGVAFKDGSLYVAEVSKLWRFDDIENNLANPKDPVLIYDDFPKDRHHGWKYIAFGPDGKLYVPVGAPCNICESKNE